MTLCTHNNALQLLSHHPFCAHNQNRCHLKRFSFSSNSSKRAQLPLLSRQKTEDILKPCIQNTKTQEPPIRTQIKGLLKPYKNKNQKRSAPNPSHEKLFLHQKTVKLDILLEQTIKEPVNPLQSTVNTVY
jgi:hypothetical protein